MPIKPTYEELERQVIDFKKTVADQVRTIDDLSTYKDIISSTPDGIAFIDNEYRYVFVNDSYERFSGRKRDSFAGVTIPENLGKEVFKNVIQPKFDRCLQGEIINFQGWFEYAAVGRRYVDITYFPYRSAGKTISGVIANTRDITARKLSEERLKQTLAAANVGIWEWDLKTNKNTWSDELWQLYGLDPPEKWEPSCESWRQSIHPEDRVKIEQKLSAATKQGCEFNLEWRVPTGDASVCWLMSLGFPQKDQAGDVIAYRGIVIDITKQKLTEKQYRDSESLYQDLVETSQDLIWQCDTDGRYTYLNPAWQETFGYTTEEMLGKKFSDFQTPEYAARDKKTFDQILQGTIVKGYETVHIHRDNQYIHLVFNAKSFTDNAGNIAGTCGTAYDITERHLFLDKLRQSEENYHNLFDKMLDGFALHEMIYDSSGVPVDYRFLRVNPAFEQLTGLKAEDLLGRTVLDVLPDTEKHWIDTYGKVAVSGNPIFFENYSIELKKHFEVAAYRPAKDQFACIFQDVTRRKIAEEKLKEALEFNQLVIQTSPIGLLVFKKSGPCVMTNPAAAQIANASEERLLQLNFKEMDSYRRSGILTDIERSLTTGEVIHRAIRVVNTFGKEVWFDGFISSFEINGKKHILYLFQDIWEKKILEQQLMQQFAEYQAIFNSINSGVAIYRPVDDGQDFILLNINEAGEKISRVKNKDVVGKRLLQIFPNMAKVGFLAVLQQVHRSGIAVDMPEFYNKDGHREGWRKNFIYKLPSCEIVAIYDDITERKLAEEKLFRQQKLFETMFNSIPDGVIVTDTNRVIVLANKGMEYTFGYRPDDLLGKTTEMLYADQRYYHQTGEAVFNGKAQKQGDRYLTHYKKSNGMEFPGETFGAKLYDENNRWIGNLGIMRDVTERIRQAEEGKILEKQLSQAQKMEAIGVLAGGIAHDFNNILGAILGYAEMVHDDCPSDSLIARDIEQIIIAGNRAKDLVRQILAFSRQSEAERIILQPAIVVRELLKLLRATLPTTIDIVQDISVKAGLISADPTQVHQLLMNLCTNAFHAMEETGGTLGIFLKRVTLNEEDLTNVRNVLPGDFILLSVTDTGPGIEPEIKSRIFDPYFTTKKVGKGTGMGLAIAHGIISSYGGFIRCDSKIGEGSTFKIFIPVADDQRDLEESSVGSSPAGGQNERILFIDDEEPLAQLTQTMLERLGYSVTIRTSSLEALATFRNDPDAFDVVITDQTMPGMNGFDLARRMLQIKPHLPIILCTGFSTVISEEKAKSVGIKGFALKPISKKEITHLIRSVLPDSP